MKKSIITLILIVSLACGLSISAFAAPENAASFSGLLSMTDEQRDEITQLRVTILDNRTALLDLKIENIQLANELKDLLYEIQANDEYVLTEENLDELHALTDKLQSKRDALEATVGDIDALVQSYADYRMSRDFESAITILEQIIDVQEERIVIKTEIGFIIQDMIDIVEAG